MENSPENQTYKIKLKGHINKSWAEWFDGFVFTYESDGTTTLYGPLPDQTVLHSVLDRIMGRRL